MPDESLGRWIPLESNPKVFDEWAKQAGVRKVHFEDVYGLDDDTLALVPRPVKAVLLLFPIDEAGEILRKFQDELIAQEGQPKVDDTIFWVKQKISNACGTIGLIHAIANAGVQFTPTSPLQKFIFECQDKSPDKRADLLSTTPHFASIHGATSQMGQTKPVDDTELHFTCFVEAPEEDFRKAARQEEMPKESMLEETTGMRLIELDGRRAGPIDHGECKDLLSDSATLIKRQYLATTSSINFSLVVLVQD